MKVRTGFVSNSSSSSFICDICGREESGMDMSAENAGMIECINGHTFCEEMAIDSSVEEQTDELLIFLEGSKYSYGANMYKELLGIRDKLSPAEFAKHAIERWEYEGDGESFPSQCPICQFKYISTKDITRYMMKKHGTTKEEILEEFVTQFENYQALEDYLL